VRFWFKGKDGTFPVRVRGSDNVTTLTAAQFPHIKSAKYMGPFAIDVKFDENPTGSWAQGIGW
jgi:hypothetical protein